MNDDNLLLLDDVCKKFFNLTPKIAYRKAAVGTLPVPAFRLTATHRGPMYVQKDVLESHMATQIASATKLNNQMRAAGAV